MDVWGCEVRGALSVYVGRGEHFEIRFLLINVVFEWFPPHLMLELTPKNYFRHLIIVNRYLNFIRLFH